MLLRPRARLAAVPAAVAAVPFALAACNNGNDDCSDPSVCVAVPVHDASTDGRTGADAPVFDRPTTRPTDIVSIALLPADATVAVTDSARPTVNFTVRATQRDGLTRTLATALRFTIDDNTFGSIDSASGLFTPTGVGGTTRVRVATVDGTALAADTPVTVTSQRIFRATGVTDVQAAAIDGAALTGDGTAQSPHVDDPLEGAVMPRNMHAPDFQWTPQHPGAGAGDVYHVRLERTHATLDAYLVATAGFHHDWVPDAAVWAAFAQSDLGTPITMTVRVLAHGMAWQSVPRRFRTVDAVIAGSVYTWSPSQRSLTRLDVDTANLANFLPHPGDTCIGCHAVSRDGQRLAGFLEGSGENLALYDLAADLTPNPAPVLARIHYAVRRCTSFNGDGTRLVSGDCGANPSMQRFSLINATTGMETPVVDGSPGDGFDPEWAPDGHAIAYTDRMNNLTVTPALGGDRFGAAQQLHAASAGGGGTVDWHPTWSPDSRWIVFQHGDSRRSGVDMGTGTRGSLWMIAAAGGTPVPLANANTGGTGTETWRPVFSPFDSGGYFWVLFTSGRPYGNTLAGTRNLKQIWVSAIRHRPDGTSDPSEVGWYLAGQERVNTLSPFWTPAPCRPTGRACSTSSECCTGECDPDASGMRVCMPPRMTCRARGQMCEHDSDCCMGLACGASRTCDFPPPA